MSVRFTGGLCGLYDPVERTDFFFGESKMKPDPTFDQISESLEYSPDTGVITWKRRGWVPRSVDIRCAGNPAGCITAQGYIRIGLYISGVKYHLLAHRVAWCLMTGEWPSHEIDHKDGVPSNNAWVNLRKANRTQNNVNRRAYGRSGFKGCHFCVASKKWKAIKCINGANKYLGTFETAEEAHAAFCRESEAYHGEFSHHLSS